MLRQMEITAVELHQMITKWKVPGKNRIQMRVARGDSGLDILWDAKRIWGGIGTRFLEKEFVLGFRYIEDRRSEINRQDFHSLKLCRGVL